MDMNREEFLNMKIPSSYEGEIEKCGIFIFLCVWNYLLSHPRSLVRISLFLFTSVE